MAKGPRYELVTPNSATAVRIRQMVRGDLFHSDITQIRVTKRMAIIEIDLRGGGKYVLCRRPGPRLHKQSLSMIATASS